MRQTYGPSDCMYAIRVWQYVPRDSSKYVMRYDRKSTIHARLPPHAIVVSLMSQVKESMMVQVVEVNILEGEHAPWD